jgi:hypothetical protein
LTLGPGSTFTFFVDGSLGTVTSVTTPIAVESSTLLAGDFSISFAGGPAPVIVTYNGAPKTFAFGECLSVKITLIASAQAGPGKLSLSSQFVSAVNGNLPFTTVSIVDFANSGTVAVTHDQSLIGEGTGAMPLGIAPGGVTAGDLASNSVTAANIASGQVVKSLNGLRDNVTLSAGTGISISPSGNTLTVQTSGVLSSVTRDTSLTGNGTPSSPLGVAASVKAMLFVNEAGKLVRCYNGISGVSMQNGTTGLGCGYSVFVPQGYVGDYVITLPPSINALFWFVTPETDSSGHLVGSMVTETSGGTFIEVRTFATEKGDFTFAPFMLVVY